MFNSKPLKMLNSAEWDEKVAGASKVTVESVSLARTKGGTGSGDETESEWYEQVAAVV